MVARRRVRGDRAIARLLRAIPDAAKVELVDALEQTGDAILSAQRAGAPKRTGAMAAALSKRVYPRTMRLRVGFVGVRANRRAWYSRVIEGGRKAQTVTARRRTKSGVSSYEMRVRAMAKRPFVFSDRVRAIRNNLGGKLRSIWDRILRRAAQGISDG